jgi:hypothetical protein
MLWSFLASEPPRIWPEALPIRIPKFI